MNLHNKEKIWSFWLPLIVAIVLYSIGDVLLKKGNIEISSTFSSLFRGNFWIIFISNFSIIFGFVLALTSRFIVGYIFSKNPFGLTEGIFLAVSVIFAFVSGIVVFNEVVTFTDIIAISLISIGIVFVYMSKSYQSSIRENNNN